MKKLLYIFDGEEVEYSVDITEIYYVLKNNILKNKSKDELIDIILNNEDKLEDFFEDELLDFYEEIAYEVYKEATRFSEDPLGYYGLCMKDFI